MAINNINDFIKTNEVLNDLGHTLKNMYVDDSLFKNDQALSILTEETYKVLLQIDVVKESLEKDTNVLKTAETFNVTTESVVDDIIRLLLASTVAKQALIIRNTIKNEEE